MVDNVLRELEVNDGESTSLVNLGSYSKYILHNSEDLESLLNKIENNIQNIVPNSSVTYTLTITDNYIILNGSDGSTSQINILNVSFITTEEIDKLFE